MKTNYLFPHWIKKPASILLFIFVLYGFYVTVINEPAPDFLKIVTGQHITKGKVILEYLNLHNTILGVLLIVFSMLTAFSREKEEGEYIAKIRLDSLVWAVYVNYGLLLMAFLLFYDLDFFTVMTYNMFTILIFFIILFNIQKYRLQKSLRNEE